MFYFDTSFIVPYFLPEAASLQAEKFLRKFESGLTISQWTKTEFASAVGMKCRMGLISPEEVGAAHRRFEKIVAEYFLVLPVQDKDFALAAEYLRHWDRGLRSGDALHLAIAKNNHVQSLYSLDKVMIVAAGEIDLLASFGI
ncbi:MAG: type II toxin-antitoxin system VapC family toxin [Sulfuricella sp.]